MGVAVTGILYLLWYRNRKPSEKPVAKFSIGQTVLIDGNVAHPQVITDIRWGKYLDPTAPYEWYYALRKGTIETYWVAERYLSPAGVS